MAEVTPDPIMRIAMGFMATKHLFIASEIGLFEKPAGAPATLDELAAKCGVPRRTLRISADAMASLGLLEREGDRYRNSAAPAAFLGGAAGFGLRPMLRFWDKDQLPGVAQLSERGPQLLHSRRGCYRRLRGSLPPTPPRRAAAR